MAQGAERSWRDANDLGAVSGGKPEPSDKELSGAACTRGPGDPAKASLPEVQSAETGAESAVHSGATAAAGGCVYAEDGGAGGLAAASAEGSADAAREKRRAGDG